MFALRFTSRPVATAFAVFALIASLNGQEIKSRSSGQTRLYVVDPQEVWVSAPGRASDVGTELERRVAGSRVVRNMKRSAVVQLPAEITAVQDEATNPVKLAIPDSESAPILYPKGDVKSEGNRRYGTKEVLVSIPDGRDAMEVARAFGSEPPRQRIDKKWVLTFSTPYVALKKLAELEAAGLLPDPIFKKQLKSQTVPNDPLFGEQWNLKNSELQSGVPGVGSDAVGAWRVTKGAGIHIGIIDDSLQLTHPDIASNCPPLSSGLHHDFNGNGQDPSPVSEKDFHGTLVGGVAAAVADNSVGLAGVAPEATLVGLRLISEPTTDEQDASALGWKSQVIGVYNCSWGPGTEEPTLPDELTRLALRNGVTTGRGGKGSIFVFAGGNGRERKRDSNYNGFANSTYTIAAAAYGPSGKIEKYSEPGANINLAAPASMLSTDVTGEKGLAKGSSPGGDYAPFPGTSAATPGVSGAAALMLSANPELGWRDVHEILMSTTKLPYTEGTAVSDKAWSRNDGGFWFSNNTGAGFLDADAAVARCQGWRNLGLRKTISRATTSTRTIPDGSSTGVTEKFDFRELPNLRVEHVQVTCFILHNRRSDLRVTLISPSGTKSLLAVPDAPLSDSDDSNRHFFNWTFMSVQNWGENSDGIWKVEVCDLKGTVVGTTGPMTLTIHGSESVKQRVNFDSKDLAIREGASAVTLSVTRSGDATEPSSVEFRTMAKTAEETVDFAPTSGTLLFAAGETTKDIVVPLNPLTTKANQRSFRVLLDAPVGMTFGGANMANVRILPNSPSLGALDKESPRVSTLIPTESALLSTSAVKVRGYVQDDTFAEVRYRINGSSWRRASGFPLWRAEIEDGLLAGQNILEVQALDLYGHASDITVTPFSYVKTATLTVGVSGKGTVKGKSLGSTVQEPGATVALTAKPNPGWIFRDWSGDDHYDSPAITFAMPETSLSLTANFIPSPFPAGAGLYAGFLSDSSSEQATGGYFRLLLTSGGSFSGTIVVDGRSVPFTGKLDISGAWSGLVQRQGATPLQVSINVDLFGGTDRLTGSVSDGALLSYALIADRGVFSKRKDCPITGSYTFTITPGANGHDGFGYGRMSISRLGTGTIVGVLGNGTKFSAPAFATKDGEIPLYASTAKGEQLEGMLTVPASDPSEGIEGLLRWYKPEEFDEQVQLEGSRYLRPAKGSRVLSALLDRANNAEVYLEEGGLVEGLDLPLTISTRNTVTAPQGASVLISPSSGLFRGQFLHPLSRKAIPFAGVFIQRQQVGRGQFMLPALTTPDVPARYGRLELVPVGASTP